MFGNKNRNSSKNVKPFWRLHSVKESVYTLPLMDIQHSISLVLTTRFHIWFIMTLYYKMRQILLQNATILLQNPTLITKCNVYYKLRQYQKYYFLIFHLIYYHSNLRSLIIFCLSSGDIYLSLGISLSCSSVSFSKLFWVELLETFVILLAISLLFKSPVASTVFWIFFFFFFFLKKF